MFSPETIKKMVNVILRIPSLFIVDYWFLGKTLQSHFDNVDGLSVIAGYMALAVAVVVATLPLRHLFTFYIHMVCAGLMVCAGMVSKTYVTVERQELFLEAARKKNITLEQGLSSLLEDRKHVERLVLHVLAQVFIATVVAHLMKIENWVKFTLLVFALPMVAKLMGFSVQELHLVHRYATVYTILLSLFCIVNKLGNIIDTCKERINGVIVLIRAFGITPVVLSFWRTMVLNVQLSLFWGLIFVFQIYVCLNSPSKVTWRKGWLFVLLAEMSECCATPVRFLAFSVIIKYASAAILCLTKLYLQSWNAFEHDAVTGWSEAFPVIGVAVSTNFLKLQPPDRVNYLLLLFLLVGSSLIQSMYEITDPVLLALSASHNPSVFKHVKAVVLCIVLWTLPLYMTYFICQYFYMNLWLMAILSDGLLNSVRVVGSLVVYMLFMYDFRRSEPWDNLDDVIYYTRAVTHIIKFIVAVFIACIYLKELIMGTLSLISSIFLVGHCLYIWQRLQSGWKSFLLSREAAKKVESLPQASEEQLACYDDVCAICYSEMKTACITPCEHMFHCVCLRKWLYVKETCPMCHRDLAGGSSASGEDGNGGNS